MVYSDLERDVSIYCGQLRNKHKKQRRYVFHDGKAKPLWDLPKCAIACRRENVAKIYHDFSKPTRVDTYDRVPLLKARLLRYVAYGGRIGDLTNLPNCGNRVGRCAEPHAAKRCMLDQHDTTIAEIIFSAALDITTGEPMEPCAICKAVFDTIE